MGPSATLRSVSPLLWVSSILLEYGLFLFERSFFRRMLKETGTYKAEMLLRIPSNLGDFAGFEILGKGWGLEGVDGCVCASSSPIQHIWNIWGLEVCSNAERHSETHKETFSSSPLSFCYKPVALYVEKSHFGVKLYKVTTSTFSLHFFNPYESWICLFVCL